MVVYSFCSKLFFEAVKSGYVVIGRLNPIIDFIFNSVELPIASLWKQTKGTILFSPEDGIKSLPL